MHADPTNDEVADTNIGGRPLQLRVNAWNIKRELCGQKLQPITSCTVVDNSDVTRRP